MHRAIEGRSRNLLLKTKYIDMKLLAVNFKHFIELISIDIHSLKLLFNYLSFHVDVAL